VPVDTYEAEREAQEVDEAWRELVKTVLSSTTVDPKYKGKKYEFFVPYNGEVTPDHVRTLQNSNFGHAFQTFLSLRKFIPENSRPEIYDLREMFEKLSLATHSPFRRVQRLRRDRSMGGRSATVSERDILREVTFIDRPLGLEDELNPGVNLLAEALNDYLRIGIEMEDVDREVLRFAVCRAARERRKKKRVTEVVVWLIGHAISFLAWFSIGLGILIWSLHHLPSFWAIVGFFWLATAGLATVIHNGLYGTRYEFRKILQPGWDQFEPALDQDLKALDRAINRFDANHINLRLAREQLARLQSTDVDLPVQLLTLIDRAIAKGRHHW
jgi:hypothetical protein